MPITSTITDKGATATIARLTGVAKFGYRPFMQAIGRLWLQQVEAEFITRTDPYGLPWKKLKAYTVQLKKEEGYSEPTRQLYATGDLSRSWFYTAGPKRVRIESHRPELAEKHQNGGVASNGSELVARPMMPSADNLPASWTKGVNDAFADLRIYLEQG